MAISAGHRKRDCLLLIIATFQHIAWCVLNPRQGSAKSTLRHARSFRSILAEESQILHGNGFRSCEWGLNFWWSLSTSMMQRPPAKFGSAWWRESQPIGCDKFTSWNNTFALSRYKHMLQTWPRPFIWRRNMPEHPKCPNWSFELSFHG